MPTLAISLLIILPWLNPFSAGPSPAVVPLLFAWACAAALLGGGSLQSDRASLDRLVRASAGAWLAAALLSAAIGLLQYFGATAAFGVWVNSSALGEAYANLRQRNQFATLTNIGLAALLWWLAPRQSAPGAQDQAVTAGPIPLLWRRLLPLLAAVLLAAGNAASSSRTGLVQLGLLLALTSWWGGWRQPALRRVLLAAALAYALAALALPALAGLDPNASGILARLQAGDPACASRLTLWGNVLHLIAQQPWLGWGWGELDYAHFITLYPGARFCEILDNAHNLPLQLAVELGLPVALLICGGGLWLAWRAKPWRETDATRQLAWVVLALILLHSLLEYPLWYGPFQMAFGLSLWFLWCTSTRRTRVAGHFFDAFRPLTPVVYGVLAAILIAIIAFAGWDYQRISQIYLTPESRSAAYREHTLAKVRDSWLFRQQVRFAELSTTPLTPANAAQLRVLATDLLHFSPEPRVAETLIESATLLGRDDEALFYLVRYQAAFPDRHARWAQQNER
jgi:O-antigen ligase